MQLELKPIVIVFLWTVLLLVNICNTWQRL